MAIAVNSFETLDKDLEIGIRQLTEVVDNKIYSIRQDIEDGILNFVNDFIGPVKDVFNKITSTANMIINAGKAVIEGIARAIDRIVGTIMDAVSNSYVVKLLGELKGLSQDGVRDFLITATGAGSVFYCYNLDSLQSLLEGAYLDPNIVDGLLMGLMLDWANTKCKPMSPLDEYNSTNRELLDVLVPYSGKKLDHNNVVREFESTMKGYLRWEKDSYKPTLLKKKATQYVTDLETSSPTELLKDFDGSLSNANKESITKELNTAYKGSSDPKYKKKVLEFKGLVNTLPTYSRKEVIASNNLPRNKDVLGCFIKNLDKVDLDAVGTHKLNDNQRNLLNSLKEIKKLCNDPDIKSRGYKEGEFYDYDFTNVVKTIEEDDQNYLLDNKDINPDGHRYNGLHPTSEVFIDSGTFRPKKEIPVDPNFKIEYEPTRTKEGTC